MKTKENKINNESMEKSDYEIMKSKKDFHT